MDKRVTSSKDIRRRHSESLKRELVDLGLEPGASVAAIAQKHGINANLRFNWRRLRLRSEKSSNEAEPSSILLPVTVQATSTPAVSKSLPTDRASQSVIEIDIGPARVRLRGAVDEASVRRDLRAIGSTPTALFAERLEGVTEVRAGVFVFFDLVMAGLNVCRVDDIALSVLATVIGHQREKGWTILDAEWMAMSHDRGTAAQPVDQGCGLVCDPDGRPLDARPEVR